MAGPWAKALVDPAIVRGEVLIQRGQRVPFLSVYHRAPLWRGRALTLCQELELARQKFVAWKYSCNAPYLHVGTG